MQCFCLDIAYEVCLPPQTSFIDPFSKKLGLCVITFATSMRGMNRTCSIILSVEKYCTKSDVLIVPDFHVHVPVLVQPPRSQNISCIVVCGVLSQIDENRPSNATKRGEPNPVRRGS